MMNSHLPNSFSGNFSQSDYRERFVDLTRDSQKVLIVDQGHLKAVAVWKAVLWRIADFFGFCNKTSAESIDYRLMKLVRYGLRNGFLEDQETKIALEALRKQLQKKGNHLPAVHLIQQLYDSDSADPLSLEKISVQIEAYYDANRAVLTPSPWRRGADRVVSFFSDFQKEKGAEEAVSLFYQGLTHFSKMNESAASECFNSVLQSTDDPVLQLRCYLLLAEIDRKQAENLEPLSALEQLFALQEKIQNKIGNLDSFSSTRLKRKTKSFSEKLERQIQQQLLKACDGEFSLSGAERLRFFEKFSGENAEKREIALKMGEKLFSNGDPEAEACLHLMLELIDPIDRDQNATAFASAHDLLARIAYAKGELEQEENHLQQVLTIRPADPEKLRRLASNLEKREEFEKADLIYDKLLQVQPEARGEYYRFCIAAGARCQAVPQTMTFYEKALTLEEEATSPHHPFHQKLADLYLQERAFDKLLSLYRRRYDVTQSPDPYLATAERALAEKDYETCRRRLVQLNRLDPENKKAQELKRRLQEVIPDEIRTDFDWKTLKENAESLMQKGDWSGAEQLLRRYRDAFPGDQEVKKSYVESLWRSGDESLKKKQLDKAIALYSEAYEIRPVYGDYLNRYIEALVAKGKNSEALALSDRLSTRFRGEAQQMTLPVSVLFALVEEKLANGNYLGSEQLVRRIIQEYSIFSEVQFTQLKKAVLAIQADQQNFSLLKEVIAFFLDDGKYSRAMELYQEAVQRRAQVPQELIEIMHQAAITEGDKARNLKEHSQAVLYYQKAYALSPKIYGDYLNHLIEALQVSGNSDQALQLYREIKKCFPNQEVSIPKEAFVDQAEELSDPVEKVLLLIETLSDYPDDEEIREKLFDVLISLKVENLSRKELLATPLLEMARHQKKNNNFSEARALYEKRNQIEKVSEAIAVEWAECCRLEGEAHYNYSRWFRSKVNDYKQAALCYTEALMIAPSLERVDCLKKLFLNHPEVHKTFWEKLAGYSDDDTVWTVQHLETLYLIGSEEWESNPEMQSIGFESLKALLDRVIDINCIHQFHPELCGAVKVYASERWYDHVPLHQMFALGKTS